MHNLLPDCQSTMVSTQFFTFSITGGRRAGNGLIEIQRCKCIQWATHPKGGGGGGQTSTSEENRGEMLNLVEGGLEKVGFQGCFERGCRLNATDLTRKRVPLHWASTWEGHLTKGFCFCVGLGYFENFCVCGVELEERSRGCRKSLVLSYMIVY